MYDEAADFAHHDNEVDQMLQLLAASGLSPKQQGIFLDIGGGQGMHVWKLLPLCSHLFVADITNYSSLYDGHFLHLLREKHERHGRTIDLSKVTFLRSDAQAQVFRDGLFDFVFSFNMFEHVPNPAAAMSEMVRLVKPSGVWHLRFDPIWTSPAGNHFSHYVPEPWAHLLCSSEEFIARMRSAGASESDVWDFIHTLNRWPFRAFMDLFDRVAESKSICIDRLEYWASSRKEESRSDHPNFAKLLNLGHSELDLVVRGIRLCGRKNG